MGYKDALKARAMVESHPWPSVPVVNVQNSVGIQQVNKILEQANFEDGWFLSFHDYGSVLNMRRPDGQDNSGNQRQIHARFRLMKDGSLQAAAHTEYSPIQHPDWHLHNKDLSWDDGQAQLVTILTDGGVDKGVVSKSHS